MKIRHLISIAALAGAPLVQALSPVETYGMLSVKGTDIVDSTGKNVPVLHGMSLCGHYDGGCKEYWLPSVLSYIQTDWHASVVRAPLMVNDRTLSSGIVFKGAANDTSTALTMARKLIDAAIISGIYVIIDWHEIGNEIHEDKAKIVFGVLAKQYGNTPNIIWEIWNEPTTGWSTIASYAKNVIPVIRQYSDNIVLVGNSSWDQNPQEAGTELDGFKNIAYTVHFYNDHSHWGNVDQARSKGHCVFASEWGLSDHTGGGSLATTDGGNIGTWLSKMATWKMGWTNWELGNPLENEGGGPNVETAASLAKGATRIPSDNDPWSDASLTTDGIRIRTYMRANTPAWTLSDTSLKMSSALKLDPSATTFTYRTDSISLVARFSKDVSWTLVETGRTSKTTMTSRGTTATVQAKHLAGRKDAGLSLSWKDETVDVVLSPLGSKLTYALTGTASGVQRILGVQETKLHWEGSRLQLPENAMGQGARVVVTLRDPSGRVVWQKNAVVGAAGMVDLGAERPRQAGIQVLDVTDGQQVVRSSLAPAF